MLVYLCAVMRNLVAVVVVDPSVLMMRSLHVPLRNAKRIGQTGADCFSSARLSAGAAE